MHRLYKTILPENDMKILMVCLGNICRSPLAHGILQNIVEKEHLDWYVDSAGTSSYHSGEQPDQRSIAEAFSHGIDIKNQKSRQITRKDIIHFDLILAMDTSNYNAIIQLCDSAEQAAKVKMIMNYAYPGKNINVPDPYYDNGFAIVFDMLNTSIKALVETSKQLA